MNQTLMDKVQSYEMPPAAIDLLSAHPPLIIAGPTAAGKETLIAEIQNAGHGAKVVTHTTRPPRPGEQNGKDYWFVSEEEMLRLLDSGAMIEAKNIHGIQISGISLSAYQAVLDQNLKPLLSIDVKGIEHVLNHVPNIRPVFLLPPSFEIWMERLDSRGHMSHVERARRLDSAAAELEKAASNRHFILVVNGHVSQAAHEALTVNVDELTQNQNRELARQLIDHIKAY